MHQPPPISQTGTLLQRCPLSWAVYVQFGLAGLALLVLTIGFGLIGWLMFDPVPESNLWLGFLLIGFSLFTGGMGYRMFRQLPQKIKTAVLYERGLWYGGNQWLPISELAELQYNGSFPLLFGSLAEALLWRTKAGEDYLLYDEYLCDLPQLKRQLARLLQEPMVPAAKITLAPVPHHLRPSEITAYRHHPFSSVSIFGLLFLAGMFLRWANGIPIFWVLAALMLFLANYVAFYPALSRTDLLIRHPLIKGWEKAIPLVDIRELVRDDRGRLPTRMIIITNDFERHRWWCASMWEKDWLALATSPAFENKIYRYQTDIGLLIHDDPAVKSST
ncbi:MAG: hypothetical protein Q8J69_07545 [Sphingobacteriaceae bacterium]|nr:hypothetical protein [Sphingobacteriaceae bacterium]